MPYVVTQSCCADASCVLACPVNCIHPAPGEPGFAEAEMVHIDPDGCVGCGACVTACPVGAIKADTELGVSEQPFADLNADYYQVFGHADRTPLAVVPPQRRLRGPGPFRVAIVGAGPAGLYTADELLKHPEVVAVDVYDRLALPHGLARYGVAPDHVSTKGISRLFAAIENDPRFSYRLGVEVGRDLTAAELRARYDAVVYAVGASADRRLGIPGEDLPGSLPATAVVGWYNDHPDQRDLAVPLAAGANPSRRAVVVGNGNVALDVARMLARDPEELASLTGDDLAAHVLDALRSSAIEEVVLLGRRGPLEAAFTLPELIGLDGLADAGALDVRVDLAAEDRATLAGRAEAGDLRSHTLLRLADRAAVSRDAAGARRIVLRFGLSPVAIEGDAAVTGLRVVRNELRADADGVVRAVSTGEEEVIETGLVIRSIGHRGRPVADLPFDEATGTVVHEAGRVGSHPGTYVVGWAKRGPVGFIGTNKTCAEETVHSLLDDLDRSAAVPA